MNVDINSIILDQIAHLNHLFERASQVQGKEFKPFSFNDYKYLRQSMEFFGHFAAPHFFAYSVMKDMEYRISHPYPGMIWYWQNDIDHAKAKEFLPMQSQLMYDTLKAYIALLKTENYAQALIVFRSYIEYSSQFYACLLDYEFFQKYTESDVLDENYKILWFKSLRPEKVLSRIKGIHGEMNKVAKQKKATFHTRLLYSLKFKPFDSTLRGHLYDSLSGLAHGSYPAVKKDKVHYYATVFLCSIYLVESQAVIDELTSVYFNYSPNELLHKWTTIEIYIKSRIPNTILYVGDKS